MRKLQLISWYSPDKEMRRKCSTKSLAFVSRSDHDANRVTAFPSHSRATPKSHSKSKSGHDRVTAFASHRRITVGQYYMIDSSRSLRVFHAFRCHQHKQCANFGTLSQNTPSYGRKHLRNHNITDHSFHLNRLEIILHLALLKPCPHPHPPLRSFVCTIPHPLLPHFVHLLIREHKMSLIPRSCILHPFRIRKFCCICPRHRPFFPCLHSKLLEVFRSLSTCFFRLPNKRVDMWD